MRLDVVFAGILPLATACLLPSELDPELADTHPSQQTTHSRRQVTSIPIGKTDRFANGTTAPVGLGNPDGSPKESILNVPEVTSALHGLHRKFPGVTSLFTPPFETHEGRALPGLQVGEQPRVYLISGIHARERGGPDHVVYFLSDLIHAHTANSGLTYGNKTFSPEQVHTAFSAGAVALPLTNPDGVQHDQTTDSCWRKNRNPPPDDGSSGIGVDLNRNFDFVWDYETAFHPDADTGSAASNDPASEVYHGAGPASEPEVQAINWALDRYNASLSWFLDLHSFSGTVLYAWGDDDAGSEKPAQRFDNSDFDGLRGFTGVDPPDAQYKEFMTTEDLSAEVMVSQTLADAMNLAGDPHSGGVSYDIMPSVALYPTSGGSNDYVLARYYGEECGQARVYGLCVEFGGQSAADARCPFYPDEEEYNASMRQVGAGLMELMIQAAGEMGEPKFKACKD